MRVGLLSDTHVPEAPALFPEILEALAGVDLILHGGDIMLARVLDELELIAPVLAAEGNHDAHLAADPRIEPVHWLDLEGHSVALVHMFDPPDAELEPLLRHYLGGRRPDVIVCGDSHFERIDWNEGVLVVNPGSATLPRNRSPRPGHVGFLTLERGQTPAAEIVDLGDPLWRERAAPAEGGRAPDQPLS